MNGQSTINHPTNHNEQLIGKFHVVNVDKIPTNTVNNHDDTAVTAAPGQQLPPVSSSSTTDESACASRFQMIRVDRNFGRGRWKVNDYEPPENIATSTNPPVNTIENEPTNISNSTNLSTIPTTSGVTTVPANLLNDTNATSSAALAAAAASAAATTAFQQQQQRLALNNAATMVPAPNVPPPAGLLHPYPPAALANMTAPNQSYMLPNHPQFGYYPYFPPHYSHYAAQWAALAAANPYLSPQMQPSPLSTGNLGDPVRLTDAGPDGINENPMISSNPFPNPTNDHLQNAQLAAAASFIYAAHHHPHSTYVSQPPPPTTASPYTTIPAYHPAPTLPTIIPPPTQPLSLAQIIPNNTTDIQQQQPQPYQGSLSQQQAPILTSPKHEASATKTPTQQSTVPRTTANTTTAPAKPQTIISNGINIDTLKTNNPTHITDLLSSSPSIPNSQQPPPSLLSPITIQGTNPNKVPTSSLTDIWGYTATGSPLNLSQTAAVAEMNLLNNENSQNTEIAHEILKELTTPTKQNISSFSLSERRARLRYRRQRSTTDIDNKISAAMDLVKMHLLSAVREEVTELRQQIRILNEKVNSAEHENAFLRQHVPSEIYAQYTPLSIVSSAANDPINPSTVPSSSVTSSQPIPMTSLSSLPLSLSQQQPSTSTTSQTVSVPPPPPPPPSVPSSSTNLPPI